MGFLYTEVDLLGPGCIRTSRKGKNPGRGAPWLR